MTILAADAIHIILDGSSFIIFTRRDRNDDKKLYLGPGVPIFLTMAESQFVPASGKINSKSATFTLDLADWPNSVKLRRPKVSG